MKFDFSIAILSMVRHTQTYAEHYQDVFSLLFAIYKETEL